MTVYFLALTALRAPAVVSQCEFLSSHGVPSAVVTTELAPWVEAGLDPAVPVLAMGDAEHRHPLWRAEQAVVYRLPAAVVAGAGRVAPRGRVAPLERLQRKASNVFHHSVFLRAYKIARPYLLWRVARRVVLPNLALRPGEDEVVVVDSQAVPLAWRLARRHPALKVSFSLDRTAYETGEAGGSAEPRDAAEV